MAQIDRGNYDALVWVQDELQQSLADTLEAFTRFINTPEDTAAISLCITQLHQINGTVEMLNLQGAQLLAAEMLASAIAIREQQNTDLTQIQDGLLKGLLLLPNYLKLLGSELQDHPLRLIDTINELRSARGNTIIEPSSLFKPVLSIHLPEYITPAPRKELPNIGLSREHVSHAFQVSLLYWIKNEDLASLRKMASIVNYLRLDCVQERSIVLWWVAEGIIEALLDGGLTIDPEVKLSLGKLSPPIKLFSNSDEQQLLSFFPTELVHQLLLLVARSTSTGKHVSALKKAFHLDFFDSQQHQKIYTFGDNALADVHSELLDQLQEIKAQVEQFEQHGDHALDTIQQLSEQLDNMSDTLQLLAEYPASELLQQQTEQLKGLITQQQLPDDDQLMALANTLLQVEDKLQKHSNSNQSQTVQDDQLKQSVISECLDVLSNVKETLSLLAVQPDNTTSVLTELSNQLELIGGSLTMLNLAEAASLVENTTLQMVQTSQKNRRISEEELGLFAEIISAIDLYLEGVTQHGQQQTQLLNNAQNLLVNLGQSELVKADETVNDSQTEALIVEIAEPLSLPETETGVERYIRAHTQLEKNETSVDRYIKNQIELEKINQPEIEAEQISQFAEGIDPEIADIFIEEANEVLAELKTLIPDWQSQHEQETLTDIRRHFHTLKGSGRMAGANLIGELSWSVEHLLNHVVEGSRDHSPAIEQLVIDTYQIIPELLTRFMRGDMSSTKQVEDLISRVNNLLGAETETETSVARYISKHTQQEPPETGVERYIKAQLVGEARDKANLTELDELQQIFYNEAAQHIATLKQALSQAISPFYLNKEWLRAAHSLKGCANIAKVTPIALIATQLDQALHTIYEQNVALEQQELALLTATIDGIATLVESHLSPQIEEPDIRPLTDMVYQITPKEEAQKRLIEPELLVAYLEETNELLDQYTEQLKQLQQQPDNTDYQHAIQHTLGTLTTNAEHANLSTIAELYQLLAQLTQQSASDHNTVFSLLERGYEALNNQIECLIQNRPIVDDISAYRDEVERYLNQIEIEQPAPDQDSRDSDMELFTIPTTDTEVLEAFTEECAELLESSGNAIKTWQQNHHDQEAEMQLQRDLHTIKGGARLAAITPIADLTHHTESLMSVGIAHRDMLDNQFFDLLQRCQDRLADMQDHLTNKNEIAFSHDLLAEIFQFIQPFEATLPETEEIADLETQTPKIEQATLTPEPVQPEETKPTAQTTAVEQVRVRSDLLDFLTNFAGEVNISRDRVTQQNSAVKQQLSEMEATVARLQDQLRSLEIETETQILFRYEDELPNRKSEFDPLELDRFSMIQQLSRGLTESVSDLNDISQSLNTLVRDTDTILLQQSRLSTDLQQGLMNTRLLPFVGLVPRFERIVRQTNTELGKKSELSVQGAERELDRTILDRIVAPIEHILRNAIAHGIESQEKRLESGKDETGQLTLTIARDGSEILITLSDDGQGINVEKIRQKALDQGLVKPDEMPSDEDLIQLIFTSGFSTADSVSQIAGRGVGMEVVSSDIRALKGRLSIQSVSGQGTTFIIRLPLTLSIMQTLLVSSYHQQYAIPLAAVHSGERIAVSEIKDILAQEGQPHYEFIGESYRFVPLAHLVDQPFSLPDNPKLQLPLLLFRYGDMNIALLVDSINSNREIVLKSVGEQLGHIAAINGATILGDGQVVFVIDIPTLVDTSNLLESGVVQPSPGSDIASEEIPHRVPVAMVVDDSITMRKASGNLLKRHGFEVITARDGIDAVAQLNEKTPDIILLDVEMPRMDGFEFAALVRNDEKYNDLPIIMITSRTGDKHRDRATSIGVNAYMGKPYQELDLVKTMQKLLGDKYPQTRG